MSEILFAYGVTQSHSELLESLSSTGKGKNVIYDSNSQVVFLKKKMSRLNEQKIVSIGYCTRSQVIFLEARKHVCLV